LGQAAFSADDFHKGAQFIFYQGTLSVFRIPSQQVHPRRPVPKSDRRDLAFNRS